MFLCCAWWWDCARCPTVRGWQIVQQIRQTHNAACLRTWRWTTHVWSAWWNTAVNARGRMCARNVMRSTGYLIITQSARQSTARNANRVNTKQMEHAIPNVVFRCASSAKECRESTAPITLNAQPAIPQSTRPVFVPVPIYPSTKPLASCARYPTVECALQMSHPRVKSACQDIHSNRTQPIA